MNLLFPLRILWPHRAALVAGFLVAAAAAVLMSHKVSPGVPPKLESRKHNVAYATTSVLVDTTVSQAVAGGSDGTDGPTSDVPTLVPHADLLASLLATNGLRDEVAKAAGIPPASLIVIAPVGSSTPAPALPAVGTVLDLNVQTSLPIIGLNARAPDQPTARALIDAAVGQLRKYVADTADAHAVPNSQRLVVSQLGPVKSSTVTAGPRKLLVLGFSLVLFAFWSAALMLLPVAVSYRRTMAPAAPDVPAISAAPAEPDSLRTPVLVPPHPGA